MEEAAGEEMGGRSVDSLLGRGTQGKLPGAGGRLLQGGQGGRNPGWSGASRAGRSELSKPLQRPPVQVLEQAPGPLAACLMQEACLLGSPQAKLRRLPGFS